MLKFLDGRWFVCFFADVPRFRWAREVPVLRPVLNQVLEAGGVVLRRSAGARLSVNHGWRVRGMAIRIFSASGSIPIT